VKCERENVFYEKFIFQIRPLTIEEKKFLLAVERGDVANVRRCVRKKKLVLKSKFTSEDYNFPQNAPKSNKE
jgi:hypothetical protein